MDAITHREMRNQSAEVLRRVEAGESLVVTNHGRPVAVLAAAERVPAAPGGALGTLDALHLVSAQRLGLTTVMTYDDQLTQTARHHRLDVVAPR